MTTANGLLDGLSDLLKDIPHFSAQQYRLLRHLIPAVWYHWQEYIVRIGDMTF